MTQTNTTGIEGFITTNAHRLGRSIHLSVPMSEHDVLYINGKAITFPNG